MEQGDYKICFYIDPNAKPAQISKTLLEGLYDKQSPLSMLRGCPFLLRTIWRHIIEQHGEKARQMRNFTVKSQKNAFRIAEQDLKKPTSISEYPFYEMKKAQLIGDKYMNPYDLAVFDMIQVSDQNRWPWEFMNE